MAVLLSSVPEHLAGEILPHKTWTREELSLVEETGVFAGTHFELIEGELIDKMGKKHRHVKCTKAAVMALEDAFGRNFVIQVSPIEVSPEDSPRNEPEPDVVVLRRPFQAIEGNPLPSDISLVVEVADTSLRQDTITKARLYARAGIPEYWIFDLNARQLHVLRSPIGDEYQLRFTLSESNSVSPLAKPDCAFALAPLFV